MAGYGAATALIVVDVQNDFADPAGSLNVRGGETLIPFVNQEIARATATGAALIYSHGHPPVMSHFARDGGIWPVMPRPMRRCPGDRRRARPSWRRGGNRPAGWARTWHPTPP